MSFARVATRLFAVALHAFPPGHRSAYAAEMLETFDRAVAARISEDGAWHALRFVLAALLDTIVEGFGERRRARSKGMARFGFSWLDVKLGLRMLARYPVMSLAGGFGIAVVVVCGAAAGVFHAVVNGTLPFEDGDRVVAIENWDTSASRPQARALHDFASWRGELTTVEDVGAYRLVTRNLAAAGGVAEPVPLAEISASAFRVARVPALRGRYLVDDDEREGAPPVIVVGHDEWQRRFAGDPQIVGRTVRLGDTTATIVGVMPQGFGFPVNERYWIPLRLKPSDYARGGGPPVYVFGRLADSTDLAAAQAELTVVGQRAAAAYPDTHGRLRPRVLPYGQWYFASMQDGELLIFQALLALLLGVVGANVAVLVYARTATRRVEIAVRSALGASRRRIVGQMFIEGFVLSCVSAAAGLLIAGVLGRQLHRLADQAPFWVDVSVTSNPVLAYVLVIAVVGAVIVGVIPALQATRRSAQTGLQHAATSLSNWKIGRTYAVLIVVQVALAVAILPEAVSTARRAIQYGMADPGFAADELLVAHLALEREMPSTAQADARSLEFRTTFGDRRAELARRLEAEPNVAAATFLTAWPGNEPRVRIEIEEDERDLDTVPPAAARAAREVGLGAIGLDFPSAAGVPLLAGRSFELRDLDVSSQQVIVNQTFAQELLGGNALGRRIRQAGSPGAAPGPWLEIVGVLADFPAAPAETFVEDASLYTPVGRDDRQSVLLAIRARGVPPLELADRLREITTALDSRLQLDDIRTMDAILWEGQIEGRMAAFATGLIASSVLLLSATGIYALIAFTVAQRRREIGIRVALGANPRRILARILSRSLWQLAAGIAIGSAIPMFLTSADGDLAWRAAMLRLPAVAAFVLLVGLLAAAGPALRALRIQPTEALREP